jgi:hypothetical protein
MDNNLFNTAIIAELSSLLLLIAESEKKMVANHYLKLWQDMPNGEGRKYINLVRDINLNDKGNRGFGFPTAISVYLKDIMYSELSLDIDDELMYTLNLN